MNQSVVGLQCQLYYFSDDEVFVLSVTRVQLSHQATPVSWRPHLKVLWSQPVQRCVSTRCCVFLIFVSSSWLVCSSSSSSSMSAAAMEQVLGSSTARCFSTLLSTDVWCLTCVRQSVLLLLWLLMETPLLFTWHFSLNVCGMDLICILWTQIMWSLKGCWFESRKCVLYTHLNPPIPRVFS